MKELNFREINLLNVLLDQEFVTADELMQFTNISLRTLQAELNLINEVLAREFPEIQIINQRGKGYCLEYPMDQIVQVNRLKRHCKNYLNVSMNKKFSENQRIRIICLYFFRSGGYLKVEEIAETLNVSATTVAKDMRRVREFLEGYQLSLHAIPYYGMKVEGAEQAVRSCMIDLLDVYIYSEEPLFGEVGVELYGLTREQINAVAEQVRSVIMTAAYPLTDNGFKRLTKYLLILPFRNGLQKELSPQEKQVIRQLTEHKLAETLIGSELPPAEIDILALFILTNSEVLEWQPGLLADLFPEVIPLHHTIITEFNRQYQASLNEQTDITRYLQSFLYQFYLRKKYRFIEREILRSQRRTIKQFTSTLTFAILIYFALPHRNETDFYDALFFDFVSHLYHLVCRLQNEYEPTNIVIINDSGKMANDGLITKLRQYESYNVQYHYRYLYELEAMDFSKYDTIFLSEEFYYDTRKIPIPTLTFGFFLSPEFSSLLWSRVFSTKRKLGSVIDYLVTPQMVTLKGDFVQIVEQITDYFMALPDYQTKMSVAVFRQFIKSIILSADYSKHAVNKLLTLFATGEMKHRYYIFRFEQPVLIRERHISSLQFVFLDLSKGLLEIKNGDSQLRRYTM